MEGPNKPHGQADDWWWLTVIVNEGEQPNVHLYELGYATKDEGSVAALVPPLTTERMAEILAELGSPQAFTTAMAPGRPNAWLEPKELDESGAVVGPIHGKPGVTVHLKDE